MNYIGQKIKQLRREQDMTQEKLAEYLGVSYQTVSKWECGVTSPDVYMLAPIACLFGITTDELLGVTDGNARKAELNNAYENYWQKDNEKMLVLARQAVAEFPGELKYKEWLASEEFYAAFSLPDEEYLAMLEQSVKHYRVVIENTTHAPLKEQAISGIVLSLKYLKRIEEAKQYAKMLPEKPGKTRDEVLSVLVEGTELAELRKGMMYEQMVKLLQTLQEFSEAAPPEHADTQCALALQEAMVKTVISDNNFLGFNRTLHRVYVKRAEWAVRAGEYKEAIAHLKTAKNYARQMDSLYNAGAKTYTAPLLAGVTDEWTVDANAIHDETDYWRYLVGQGVFEPLRKMEEFQKLF